MEQTIIEDFEKRQEESPGRGAKKRLEVGHSDIDNQ